MADRRTFLSGLIGLPLLGGSLSLIGSPTAAAVPVTPEMLNAYNQWLFYERRLLLVEQFGPERSRYAANFVPLTKEVCNFHFPSLGPDWNEVPQPSTRAAVVLSAVGCPLSGRLVDD